MYRRRRSRRLDALLDEVIYLVTECLSLVREEESAFRKNIDEDAGVEEHQYIIHLLLGEEPDGAIFCLEWCTHEPIRRPVNADQVDHVANDIYAFPRYTRNLVGVLFD